MLEFMHNQTTIEFERKRIWSSSKYSQGLYSFGNIRIFITLSGLDSTVQNEDITVVSALKNKNLRVMLIFTAKASWNEIFFNRFFSFRSVASEPIQKMKNEN